MVPINELNSPQLIEAVRLWTGWGQSIMPKRNDACLTEHFGEDAGAKLLSTIKLLENDFYSSNARFVAADIQEMEKMSSDHFKQKHPDVADEIVKAFAWCYTFDYK